MRRHYLFALLFWLMALPGLAQQATVTGKVLTDQDQPLEMAAIGVKGTTTGTQTNDQGDFKLTVPANQQITLVVQYVGYKQQEVKLRLAEGEVRKLEITVLPDVKVLNKVVIHGRRQRDTRDQPSIMKLDPRISRDIPSAFGDFNKMLVTLPGVVSNNELSSTYSVRGGNYDENLVYVNGIEIYRPFLGTNGQQEGLSFVNP
ncbi:MAG TPA: carboxypeptidase-like regulatory domain-containing protein, partial [Adhaeribacter sp.]|nr:carboxypeptidase-like regulatory domain-containing protein [Adhaeribacter sp.]